MPQPRSGRLKAALSRRTEYWFHECELRLVRTGAQLVRALEEAGCDLLIVGLPLDEWSAVAALEGVLSREQTFPVVCVRGAPSLSQPGGQNFIDLLQYAGDALGNARVRAMLMRLLPGLEPDCRLGGGT